MCHKLLTFHYLFLPILMNPSLFITYIAISLYISIYIYIIIPCSKGWSRSLLICARIRNFCVLAKRELTFIKRPSWKPQHLVTMYHKLLIFHYLFLPNLINPSLFTTYTEIYIYIYIYIVIPCSKGWSQSRLIGCAHSLEWAL